MVVWALGAIFKVSFDLGVFAFSGLGLWACEAVGLQGYTEFEVGGLSSRFRAFWFCGPLRNGFLDSRIITRGSNPDTGSYEEDLALHKVLRGGLMDTRSCRTW